MEYTVDTGVAYELHQSDLDRFTKACLRAELKSRESGCTVHVSAQLAMRCGIPAVVSYRMSDWYDDSVVRSYCNGRVSN